MAKKISPEKNREYKNRWKAKHPDYYKNNKAKINARSREWNKKHRKECNAANKRWFERNPWHQVWANGIKRCTNKNNISYKWYGKKGIRFLLTLEDVKFLWLRDKASLMSKPSIDRKDHNKNYNIKNCRFIELKENVTESNIRRKK